MPGKQFNESPFDSDHVKGETIPNSEKGATNPSATILTHPHDFSQVLTNPDKGLGNVKLEASLLGKSDENVK